MEGTISLLRQLRRQKPCSDFSTLAALSRAKLPAAGAWLSLEWEELPSRQGCRIACYLNDLDPEDESDWPRQHEWLAKRLNDFHRVFSQKGKSSRPSGAACGEPVTTVTPSRTGTFLLKQPMR